MIGTLAPDAETAPITSPSASRMPLWLTRLIASRTARFLIIGGASTLGYLAVYAVLRLGLPAQVANALALVLTGDVNTSLNRRWTFGLRGRVPVRERIKGIGSYLISLVTTSVALAALAALGEEGAVIEMAALLVANGVAGIAHYVLLQHWAFDGAAPLEPVQTETHDAAAGRR